MSCVCNTRGGSAGPQHTWSACWTLRNGSSLQLPAESHTRRPRRLTRSPEGILPDLSWSHKPSRGWDRERPIVRRKGSARRSTPRQSAGRMMLGHHSYIPVASLITHDSSPTSHTICCRVVAHPSRSPSRLPHEDGVNLLQLRHLEVDLAAVWFVRGPISTWLAQHTGEECTGRRERRLDRIAFQVQRLKRRVCGRGEDGEGIDLVVVCL